ncbi:MAG: hypothetical protein WA555_07720 [Candidatus Sulfotelmatobacter sp.]
MDVPVAAGFFAGAAGPLEVGENGFEVMDEQGKAFSFRANREQLLLEIQIEGQRTGEIERQYRGIGGGEILLRAGDAEQFGVQFKGAQGVFTERTAGLVFKHKDFSLEVGAFMVDADEFEGLAALGDDVEAAVLIFFYDG